MRRLWLTSLVGLAITTAAAAEAERRGPEPAAKPWQAVPQSATACPGNPHALGVSRTVEIDASNGPGFGSPQYRGNDFLEDGEIVLTFDDGPAPIHTSPVLSALKAHCAKATFFVVGRMVAAHPAMLRQIHADGHTIGTHTWSHADLGSHRVLRRHEMLTGTGSGGLFLFGPAPQSGRVMTTSVMSTPMPFEKATAEIERGIGAALAVEGVEVAPFFRFPYLDQTQRMKEYLAARNIATFSIDVDSMDYRTKRGEDVMERVLSGLARERKGIILFHDIQASTAQILPRLLTELQVRGFRLVHMRSKIPVVANDKLAVAATHAPAVTGNGANSGTRVQAKTAQADPIVAPKPRYRPPPPRRSEPEWLPAKSWLPW